MPDLELARPQHDIHDVHDVHEFQVTWVQLHEGEPVLFWVPSKLYGQTQNTDAYRRIQTHTDAYRRVQTRADAYRRVQTHTDAYRNGT